MPSAGGGAAIDGDPATAWQTAFGPATGATLDVTLPAPATIDHLDLQVVADGRHSVPTALTVAAGSEQREVQLPLIEQPPDGGPVAVQASFAPLTTDHLTVTITGSRDVTTIDRRTGEPVVLPVGLAELGLPGVPPPAPAPASFDSGCRTDLLTIDGRPFPVRVAGSTAELQAGSPLPLEPCGDPTTLTLGPGDHLLRATPGRTSGLDLDRVVLTSGAGGEAAGTPLLPAASGGPTARLTSSDRTHRTVEVEGGDGPVWLVLGEGLNRGWHASAGGHDLGPPRSVDGGMNGWLVPRSGGGAVQVSLTWTPQRQVWIGLAASLVGVVVCIALAIRRPRRADAASAVARAGARAPAAHGGGAGSGPLASTARRRRRRGRGHRVCCSSPSPRRWWWAPCSSPAASRSCGGCARWPPSPPPPPPARFYVLRQWHSYPAPGFGWPSAFELGHPLALAALAFLAADVTLSLVARPPAPGRVPRPST